MTEPKKSLGQHWLYDVTALRAMCDAADAAEGDVVLEIGPGQGTLTDQLIKRKTEVIALEYDQNLVKKLQKKYQDLPSSRIWIQEGDIRTYDFGTHLGEYKIVANIPYYLSANLLRLLTEAPYKPEIAALLVQKEVAERVAAEPGKMSLISVVAQFYYEVSLGREVKAELFDPKPKVDSQILILKKREEPLFPDVDSKEYFRIVKAGFSSRRKTLLNALSGGLRLSKTEIAQLLEGAGIESNSRAQMLSLIQWKAIYDSLKNQY